MIDIKVLRDDPARVKANCLRRGCPTDVDQLHAKDREYLALIQEVEKLRARRNELAKLSKDDLTAREEVKRLKTELTAREERMEVLKKEVNEGLTWLPNFLDPRVPEGKSDADNQCLREVGTKPTFSFKPRDHQDLGDLLGIIDTKRGAKVAASGFYFWRGAGAQLAMGMFFWAQQELIKRGFTLFMSPCAAKAQTLFGTGYLPFFADQTYNLTGEDLALIGTSEQTLVAYHADEILREADLPLCYTAFTPCFRTEAGAYGKETRGIFRVHQFHKVEQIVFCKPEDSPRCHDVCQANEEYLLQQLGLPYRVVAVCVGDMGAPGYLKYDNEAWFPGYGGYRELTSNTNLTDFQARRLGIRYADAANRKAFVHTISATAVTDRCACAILENFQREDGSVVIPEVLRPYVGLSELRPRT